MRKKDKRWHVYITLRDNLDVNETTTSPKDMIEILIKDSMNMNAFEVEYIRIREV